MKVEVRNGKIVIDGYVNAVERTSKVLCDTRGQFVERIRSGVFQRALEKAEKLVEKQPEEEHAEQSVFAFEKQQEIEKEAVEIQNEEKPIEFEDENKQEQALVVYRNLYESLKHEETAMVQQNANQFQTMMNAFAMYISNLQQKSVTLDIHKNFENSLKDYIATVTVKAPAIQGNKPMEIKISMEISRKELNQMLSFVNQKWKNIRPAKQAYKLLQSGNVEQAWNTLQEKGTRTFVQTDAIIEPIHRMLESEPIQYQENTVVAQMEKESHVKPANLIIAESIMEVEKELKETLGCETVIHMDPIVTDDELTSQTRERLAHVIHAIDDEITIHDFRMVSGKGHTNLIFDMALPSELMPRKKQLKDTLDRQLEAEESGKYYTVITFDMSSLN